MSEFLGKTQFSQGLTTQVRGVYGNNAILNECHGFDIDNGNLVPVHSVGDVVSTGNISNFSEQNDYVVEFNGAYYSFTDFKNQVYTGSTTVSSFFGSDLTLLGTPCVSDRFIVYPTNKGLFSFEPESKATSKCRYLSFMSPEDYDKYDNTTLYPKTGNDYINHHLSITNDSVTPIQLFTSDTSSYTTDKATVSYADNILSIILGSGITRTSPFSVSKSISLSGSTFKGWFIYDMKIEGDKQSYLSSTIFENNDATMSGYEIVFDNSSDSTIEKYKIGITKLEPIVDKWYRCISYVELSNASNYNRITLTNSNFYDNDNSSGTKLYIGVGSFNASTWKHLGNFLFSGEKGIGSYKDKFKRTIDNSSDNYSVATNLIKHNGFVDCTDLAGANWQEDFRDIGDYVSSVDTSGISITPTYDSTTTYTRAGKTQDYSTAYQYVSVEPNCYYEFGIWAKSTEKTIISVKKVLTDGTTEECVNYKMGDQTWTEFYTNGSTNKKEIFTSNCNQLKIEIQNKGQDREYSSWTATWLKRIDTPSFYKTTRVLYDFDNEDLTDDDKQIHNCKEYSYSFCGRNRFNFYDNVGTVKDQYKLMISNASEETEKIADHPFACSIITLNTLPVKTINSTERNVKDTYNDYFTDILLYKSIIYGQTLVQEDFSFCGKINKSWTSADSTRKRFKNNYMTTTGFYAKDDSPYDDDTDTDSYYDIDDWHAIDPQQEIYNDFLEQANCVCHLNGRLFAGNIGKDSSDNDLQKTSLAVSNYDENWIFPTSVDEGSVTGTGTQTDNLHSISNKIEALATVGDRVLIFYDKEILSLYGNDFYSSNGFGVQNIGRLNVVPKTIANTIREVIFSDGKDFYITSGGVCQNISKFKINVKDLVFTNSSAMFYDNRYFILESNKIYVYDMYTSGWWTFDKQNIKQLINYITEPMCVIKNTDNSYKVAKLFGDSYSGSKSIETMYQIISDTQADVIVNNFAIECDTPSNNEQINISLYGKGEFNEEWNKILVVDTKHYRYNNKVKFNVAVNSIKQRIDYTGSNPPTIYSIGVIRNGTKARE